MREGIVSCLANLNSHKCYGSCIWNQIKFGLILARKRLNCIQRFLQTQLTFFFIRIEWLQPSIGRSLVRCPSDYSDSIIYIFTIIYLCHKKRNIPNKLIILSVYIEEHIYSQGRHILFHFTYRSNMLTFLRARVSGK